MARASTGSARTAPKGRATRPRDAAGNSRRFLSPMVQWALVILIGLAIVGAIMYLGRDVRSTTGSQGVPDPDTVPALVDGAA